MGKLIPFVLLGCLVFAVSVSYAGSTTTTERFGEIGEEGESMNVFVENGN